MSTASVTKENWWALVLGGVATILFGVAAVFWPGLTLLTLLYLFSAYVLVSGVVNILAGLGIVGKVDSWFLPVILGALEIGVGVYLLRHPHVTFRTLVLLIGFTLIVRGIMELVDTAVVGRPSKALGYISGFIGLIAGIVILFAQPAAGVAFVWILGVYALVAGTFRIAEISSLNDVLR